MAEVKIPVFKGMFEDQSGIGASVGEKRIINGFVDQFGFINKRPAFTSANLNSAGGTTYGTKSIYAVYFLQNASTTQRANKFLILAADTTTVYVYEGDIYSGDSLVSKDGISSINVVAEVTFAVSNASSSLKFRPPKFAEGTTSTNAASVYVCFNGFVYEFYDTNLGTYADVTASTASAAIIDVAFINKRLIQIEIGTSNIYYSATGDPTDFTVASGGGSFQAETQSDRPFRIMADGNDLSIFGANSLDMYYDTGDATTPFARYNGSEIKIGLAYPDAMTNVDGIYYFMGGDFAIYKLRGREPVPISAPIDKYLKNMRDLFHVMTSSIKVEGHSFVIFTFPTVLSIDAPYVADNTPPGVTFVYHINMDKWYIWSDGSTLAAMTIRGSSSSKVSGFSYVADSSASALRTPRLDTGYSSNKEDLVVTSANISLDTNMRKASKSLTARMKGAVGPTIKHREGPDSDVTWASSTDIAVTITDVSGELMRIRRLGQYRVRQYQVTHTDNSAFSFGDMTEEVEVLGS